MQFILFEQKPNHNQRRAKLSLWYGCRGTSLSLQLTQLLPGGWTNLAQTFRVSS